MYWENGEFKQTKMAMRTATNRTMAVHVRYKFLNISSSFRSLAQFVLVWRSKTANFRIFIWNAGITFVA